MNCGSMLNRVRWLFVFAAIFLISAVGPVVAAESPPADPEAPSPPASDSQPASPFASLEASRHQLALALDAPTAQQAETVEPDAQAAEELPHDDLGRDEAAELLTGVFDPQLEGAAAPLENLEVEKYLSDYVIQIPAQSGPAFSAAGHDGSIAETDTVLLESTLPLRTEDSSGSNEPVDLSLEPSSDGLRPQNPLTDVVIPAVLGDGITLPEAGVSVSVIDSPDERAPTVIDGTTAFFPNTAPDTDLSVQPTSTGFQTFTQLRTAEAPTHQEFSLTLPEEAVLRQTQNGGAEVVRNSEPIVSISAPQAIDAEGMEVPVELSVAEDTIALTVDTKKGTAFPVLVDPTYDYFQWNAANAPAHQGWEQFTNIGNNTWQAWMWSPGGNRMGPAVLTGYPGWPVVGNQTNWSYKVPRYADEMAKYGRMPTSYIQGVTISNREIYMAGTAGQRRDSPYVLSGIWDPVLWRWAAVQFRNGAEGGFFDLNYNVPYPSRMPNNEIDTDSKWFQVGFATSEDGANEQRFVVDGAAMVELADTDHPVFYRNDGPAKWVNSSGAGAPFDFEVVDYGLGVFDVFVGHQTINGTKYSPTHYNGCTGGATNPCPLSWTQNTGPKLNYDPSILPQGENWVTMTAVDPVNHDSAWAKGYFAPVGAFVKVDHSQPKLSVSGTITEQASVGTAQPRYTLKYKATDGTHAAPQAQSPFGAFGSSAGKFNGPRGVAADQKGNVWVVDRENNRVQQFTEDGQFVRQFGSTGSGNGQFLQPYGIAITPEGNLWVTDPGNHRIQQFNSKGEYLQQIGAAGNQSLLPLVEPIGIAATGNGTVWVADRGGSRIVELSETPRATGHRFVRQVSGVQLYQPFELAIDNRGTLWATDFQANSVLSFSASGVFTGRFGTSGAAAGQLLNPTGLAVSTSGNLIVADMLNNRVQQFKPNGVFERYVTTSGLNYPAGLAIGRDNTLFVADMNNNRIARWKDAEYDPQSGIASVQIKVDGTVLRTDAPGCATQDCKIDSTWELESEKFSDGPHTVEVVAKDAVGLSSAPVKVPITLRPDRAPPTIALAGSMTEQASVGPTRPRYTLKMVASDPGASPYLYSASFGTAGSGSGQFNHPADVAVDAKGNVWVVDENNNRLQKFATTGAPIAAYGATGSGNGQFTRPTSIAIDGKGNLWIADAGNKRIQVLNEKAEFVRQFGSAGTGDGQFAGAGPEGIAVDSKGNVWVSDTYGARIQKFNEQGQFLKSVGSAGTGVGQLIEPTGLDVDPGGNVWVTDWSNNKVVKFSEAGVYLQEFGSAGAAAGQFAHPDSVDVDAGGNLWVADQGNGRIQKFNAFGDFVSQHGAKGTGPGQFSFGYPIGLEMDPQGNLWVADSNNNRIQKWTASEGTSSGVGSTRIEVDGKIVDEVAPGCVAGGCSISREWTFDSNAYGVGSHVVKATAADAVGHSTTVSRTIQIARDVTAPQIDAPSAFFNRPGGWVEQRSYSYAAEAQDPNGYGIASLALKIDGEAVKSVLATCPDGGCAKSFASTIDTSTYEGGAHAAELIATDGAGNVARRKWSMNVDPVGEIDNEEAEATLEAIEETSPANLVGEPDQAQGIEGSHPGLELKEVNGKLVADGSYVPTAIEGEPGGEVVMRVLPSWATAVACDDQPEPDCMTEGEFEEAVALEGGEDSLRQVRIEPISTGEEATETSDADDIAAISANTDEHVDTVIRPLTDGAMNFQIIRDPSATESFSWRVQLRSGQELKQISDQEVAAFYPGGEMALDFLAIPAHDAIGTTVRTTLGVSGSDILTLTVHHREPSPVGGGFVYPVVGGSGWQGGFETNYVAPLPIEEFPEEEGEAEGEQEAEVGYSNGVYNFRSVTVGPPRGETAQASNMPPGAESPSNAPIKGRPYVFNECRFRPNVGEAEPNPPGKILPPTRFARLSQQCHGKYKGSYGNTFTVTWAVAIHGRFSYKFGKKVWISVNPKCKQWTGESGPYELPKNWACFPQEIWSNDRVDVLGRWRWPAGVFEPQYAPLSDVCAELNGVLPVRPTDQVTGEWTWHSTWHWSRSPVSPNDGCPWGQLQQIH